MLEESWINDQVGDEGYRVCCRDDVASTNEMIKAAIRAGEQEGLVATALTQGAGYGRTGHAWVSPLGGLYFSVLLRPDAPVAQLPTLSQTSSLAICESLAGVDEGLSRTLAIKWPNDVMCGEGKVAGISLEQHDGAVCMGVGVNVFEPFDLKDTQVGGKYVPAYLAAASESGALPRVGARGLSAPQADFMQKLLVDLLMCFGARYRQWLEGGFAALRDDYLAHLDLVGQEVTVENLAGAFFAQGKVVNVNEAGQLVLRADDGGYLTVSAGEVHLR